MLAHHQPHPGWAGAWCCSKAGLAHGQVLGIVHSGVGLWAGAWCCPRLCWLVGRCLVLSTVVLACGQVLGVVQGC